VVGFPSVQAEHCHLILRPISALGITNSRQFYGQVYWPVMWLFPIIPLSSISKTTWALKHIKLAWEVKNLPCHLVQTRPVLANPITLWWIIILYSGQAAISNSATCNISIACHWVLKFKKFVKTYLSNFSLCPHSSMFPLLKFCTIKKVVV